MRKYSQLARYIPSAAAGHLPNTPTTTRWKHSRYTERCRGYFTFTLTHTKHSSDDAKHTHKHRRILRTRNSTLAMKVFKLLKRIAWCVRLCTRGTPQYIYDGGGGGKRNRRRRQCTRATNMLNRAYNSLPTK